MSEPSTTLAAQIADLQSRVEALEAAASYLPPLIRLEEQGDHLRIVGPSGRWPGKWTSRLLAAAYARIKAWGPIVAGPPDRIEMEQRLTALESSLGREGKGA